MTVIPDQNYDGSNLYAIREAITNSFGHRMFDSGQSNEITSFKNRIEIYNPGAFPANKTPDDGFVVVFYRHGIQKLSGTAQKEDKTAQKTARKKGSMRCLNIAKNRETGRK